MIELCSVTFTLHLKPPPPAVMSQCPGVHCDITVARRGLRKCLALWCEEMISEVQMACQRVCVEGHASCQDADGVPVPVAQIPRFKGHNVRGQSQAAAKVTA